MKRGALREWFSIAAAGGFALGLASRGVAQTSYPMVTRVEPVAVQRGAATEITVSGTQNFAGATALLFEGGGLSAEVVASEQAAKKAGRNRGGGTGSVTAKLTVSADSALGPRELRVVTPRGVSSIGLIVVTAETVAPEGDDKANDEHGNAQLLALPSCAAGAIGKVEDVDWYSIDVAADQQVTFSLWGNRLEDKIHDLQTHLDPMISLFDARGRELAVSDNQDFADPRLSFQFKEAGRYLIQVRDTSYAGNANWTYALHVTAGPFATAVFPMAVQPGKKAELRASGANLAHEKVLSFDVPPDCKLGPITAPLLADAGMTQPVPLVATTLSQLFERDDAASEAAKAQEVTLPAAICGRFQQVNDRDGFRFNAKKGQAYAFEVMSRRLGSAADPVLRLVDSSGKTLVESDDALGKDPRVEFTAPADGPITAELRDLHDRGGDEFGYVLFAEPAKPSFSLTCDPDKLNVGPGSRAPLFVKVDRRSGFNGAVAVNIEGLPPGLSASALTIPPGMTQGVVVVSAAADAKLGAGLLTIRGVSNGPEGPMIREGSPRQEIYLPGGGRGLWTVETLAAAVTEPSDIQVEASPSAVTIQPGTKATLDVTIKRRDGFNLPVNLAVELGHLGQVFASPLPAGVRVRAEESKTLIAPGQSKGTIVLEATSDAPATTEPVPIVVMGHVSVNFVVKTAYCSDAIRVAVPAKAK